MTDLRAHLSFLYGPERAPLLEERLQRIIDEYRGRVPPPKGELTERDAILITYADQVQSPDEKPLQTLCRFCDQYLSGIINGIHILPFYPWTSDDGFSVSDYRRVEPALGNWEDISRLGRSFRLMFDAVINHASVQHEWFQAFLRDDPHYREYFLVVDGDPNLSQVVRPRALPLLTPFETPSGLRRVWTTFSADQVDLNYGNPEVLLEIVDTLLLYVSQGAQLIRLDAIAYLWKEIGTSCIHLPQTHRIIQLFRSVLDEVAPHVLLITETNVPHAENISYFGDGTHEAQMVYNFALPPLVLHTLHTGNSHVISEWATTLSLPSARTTFFNFLASHDGIGINPARGILSDAEIDAMVERIVQHGGLVSYKHVSGGAQIPYELNINYFDALSDPQAQESSGIQIDRFMSAQAIMLAVVGVPGIYFHSFFGSRSWRAGVELTGRHRTINRQKFDLAQFGPELAAQTSLRYQVYHRYSQLLRARASSSAFHPHGTQQIVECGDALFSILRISPDENERVLCLHNITNALQQLNMETITGRSLSASGFADLISGASVHNAVLLQPYQTLWLRISGQAALRPSR